MLSHLVCPTSGLLPQGPCAVLATPEPEEGTPPAVFGSFAKRGKVQGRLGALPSCSTPGLSFVLLPFAGRQELMLASACSLDWKTGTQLNWILLKSAWISQGLPSPDTTVMSPRSPM